MAPRAGLHCGAAQLGRRATHPARMARNHGMVISMMVEPQRAPMPTLICVLASLPMHEKRTMAPSGTAPRIGRTTLPTRPAAWASGGNGGR